MKPWGKDEYRAAIEKLGLSQVQAGKFLGLDPRSSRRYALGETSIPQSVAMLLTVMLWRRISVERVQQIIDKQQRGQK